jgi:Tol biopolymer transport system component
MAMPFNQANTTLALSPDGLSLVLVGGGRLFLRSMDSLTLTPLPGTEGGASPEWSPDGRYVAFVAQSKLKRIDVRAGTVRA